MKSFAEYNIITGQIIAVFSVHEPDFNVDEQYTNTNLYAIEVPDNEIILDPALYQYINTVSSPATLIDRPQLACNIDTTNIAANGIDTATITNIPNPSIAIIYDINNEVGEELDITDGVLSITSSEAQTIKVIIKTTNPFPEKDFEREIIAT